MEEKMRKSIASLLIVALVATFTFSVDALNLSSNDSSREVKDLAYSKSQVLESEWLSHIIGANRRDGNTNYFFCAAAIASGLLVVGAMFSNPVTGFALGLYVANAIVGPTVSGVGIAAGC
jgi:hypothetical protein